MPFLIFLIGAGICFEIRTMVVQGRCVLDMRRAVAEPTAGAGKVSAFKAFTVFAASRVGAGNVAGVALAISIGDPGAVFRRDMLPELPSVERWDGTDPATRHALERLAALRGRG